LRLSWFVAPLFAALCVPACGSRSPLEPGTEEPPPIECTLDAECGSDACGKGRCQDGFCEFVAIDCDDDDSCTEDACNPATGCVHRPMTVDNDGDGHNSPRPGYAPGESGACGDDCDDAATAARPGGKEVCDGRDNDCNGVVDDGSLYRSSEAGPVRLSSANAERAGHGGLIGLEGGFALTMRERNANDPTEWQTFLKGIDEDGAPRFDSRVSMPNVPIDFGPLAWSGRELVTVWEDDRTSGGYEIWFARFTPDGAKLGPDVRVTESEQFSLNPSLLYNRNEFVMVWDDRRDELRGTEGSRLYGQRISPEGDAIGGNVLLTPDEQGVEYPSLAIGAHRIGAAYTQFVAPAGSTLRFRSYDAELAPAAVSESFGSDVDDPSVEALETGFAVLWENRTDGPGNVLWGALFDEEAKMLVEPVALASGASHLNDHSAISLGDRLLVVWSDDSSGNYDLYWQMFDSRLAPLGERAAITANSSDTIGPSLAVSASGSVGVSYEDYSDGSRQVYFTRLLCE
jgi:hypothetical protein